MTAGNVAALAQRDVKRMLAYSSIAHAGYILVGVAAGNQAGLQSVVFYLLVYTLMGVGVFAVASILERPDSFTTKLTDYAGLSRRAPLLAVAMSVFLFSLTGLPPLAGFWGKLYLFKAAVEANLSWLAILGVINSAISAFYYLGLVVQMFMLAPEPESESAEGLPIRLRALRRGSAVSIAVFLACLLIVVVGVWPGAITALIMNTPWL
jgi:NADH-quinone oxidoreductase subunit N